MKKRTPIADPTREDFYALLNAACTTIVKPSVRQSAASKNLDLTASLRDNSGNAKPSHLAPKLDRKP